LERIAGERITKGDKDGAQIRFEILDLSIEMCLTKYKPRGNLLSGQKFVFVERVSRVEVFYLLPCLRSMSGIANEVISSTEVVPSLGVRREKANGIGIAKNGAVGLVMVGISVSLIVKEGREFGHAKFGFGIGGVEGKCLLEESSGFKRFLGIEISSRERQIGIRKAGVEL